MGTPEFAVPSLDILYRNGYDIVGVITATDKYGGRGKKQLLESAVKKYAVQKSLRIFQPKNLKNSDFVEEIRTLKADIQVVVAFRMLPEVIWNMPKLGTINVHGSILPKFRGAAPINWAIITGENETGISTFRLKHEIDTGNIIKQTKIQIHPLDNAGSLHDKMMHTGASTLLSTIQDVELDTINPIEQDEKLVSKAPKIHHSDCEIDFSKSVKDVYNFIRGMSPYPTAWFYLNDDLKMKVYSSSIDVEDNTHTDRINSDGKKYLKVKCNDGYINLLEIQIQGKKKMDIKSFLNGYGKSFKILE